ncbi:uncharacterized protein [Aristolochia californica]|uniref:uncharacterized protein n=1 Tax=Aristolochia californica TaxID=171875 RepID=UPI0035E29BCA
MKTSIAEYVASCLVCQRNKAEHLSPAGLLQPLALPTQVWTDISMDFVEASTVAHTFIEHIVHLHGSRINYGQTEVVNRTVEMYLRCLSTPFNVLYGRNPPWLLSYTLGSTRMDSIDQALMERDQMLQNTSNRLLELQVCMKDFYDKGHWDIKYKEGDYGPPPSASPSLPPVDNGQVILTPATWKDTEKEDVTWE